MTGERYTPNIHSVLLAAGLVASMAGSAMAQDAETEEKTVGWFNSTELSLVVTEGGLEVMVGVERFQKTELDTVFRTSFVMNF